MSSQPELSLPESDIVDDVAEASEREAELRESIADESVMDFVPWCTPKFKPPAHLSEYVDVLQRALLGEPQRVVVHAPPQHTKTDTTLHGFAWGLKRNPAMQLAYSTYGDRLARKKSRRTRNFVQRCGVELATLNLNDWTTTAGGGLLATGVCGPLTGFSKIDVLVIDDPYKNRMEAESPVRRQAIEEWFDDVVDTRTWPLSSVLCFMTRWHPDDLAGYLIKNHGFRYICLPALRDDGTALWPEGSWPAPRLLEKQQRSPYTFASLFQGRPRPRGATVFGPPTVFTEPFKVYRSGFGVDLSYSTKTSAHWSIAIEGRIVRDVVQIHNVLRRQVRAPDFRDQCHTLHLKAPSARWRWYASTTEIGTADLFRSGEKRVPLYGMLAKGDKLTRAQKVAEAWNAGLVQVPAAAPWLEDFLEVILAFTGVKDACDDDVDALAALYDELAGGPSVTSSTPTEPTRTGGLRATPL